MKIEDYCQKLNIEYNYRMYWDDLAQPIVDSMNTDWICRQCTDVKPYVIDYAMDTNNIEYLKLIFQELHHHKQMYVDFAENKVDDNLTLQMNQKSFNFTFLKLIIAHGNEIYLRNYLELIPDNIPLIGNLDEAAACALILAVLRYFGFDLTRFLRTTLDEEKPPKKDS